MRGHSQMLEPQIYSAFSCILLPNPNFRLLVHYIPKKNNKIRMLHPYLLVNLQEINLFATFLAASLELYLRKSR